jgi:DNA gyrase subunit A
VMDIIREDIFEMREKYGDDRRTEITGSVSDLNMEDLIAREDMAVTVSREGYIKRLPVATYHSQSRGGRGIRGIEAKEGDFVEHLLVACTHDHILFFTNTGRTYTRRVYEIPLLSRTSAGRAVANLLDFQPGEKVTNVLALESLEKDEHFVFFATARGVVKKTPLSAFANINKRGIIAIGLDEGDSLIGVEITTGSDHIMLATKSGLAIRFEEQDVRSMGRQAGGVTGARFKRENDEVVSLLVIPGGRNDVAQVLTACENGFGKRTPLGDYPLKGRGTRGVINIDANERNGNVVGMKLIGQTDEVMLITEKGILIRTRTAEIRETGRGAAGVRIIRIDEGDRLVAMAPVDAEAAATPETPGQTPATPADGTGVKPADSAQANPAATPPVNTAVPDGDKPEAKEPPAGS